MNSSLTEQGLNTEFFNNKDLEGKAIHQNISGNIDFQWWEGAPFQDLDPDNFSVRWSGVLIPPFTGKYALGASGKNAIRLYLGDSLLLDCHSEHDNCRNYSFMDLEAGKAYPIKLEYREYEGSAEVHLLWAFMDRDYHSEAMEAARKADLVILCMGLSPRLEGEDLKVEVEGFKGGDRTNLELPEIQEKLISDISSLGKATVLCLLNGSPLAINEEQENIPAIIEAWYPGQAGGDAIADVLAGDYNPSGKLPVTFYKSVKQLPPFEDYNMEGHTYRYFRQEPLYPFGFGLSYSDFIFSGIELNDSIIKAGDSLKVSLKVQNKGAIAGLETVQLYLSYPESSVKVPLMELKDFRKLHLNAGESRELEFIISPEMMQLVDEEGNFSIQPGNFRIYIGDCLPVKRSLELGAPAWQESTFRVF